MPEQFLQQKSRCGGQMEWFNILTIIQNHQQAFCIPSSPSIIIIIIIIIINALQYTNVYYIDGLPTINAGSQKNSNKWLTYKN